MDLRDRDLARLRARLGDAAFEAAYRHGRTLSQADAIALATAAAQLDPGVASALTVPAADPATADGSAGLLSEREREIVALLAGGATDAQIAARLFLSVNTVRSHLERIRDKTGARRRADLVRYAIQAGIDPDRPLRLRAGLSWRDLTGAPGGEWAVRPTLGARRWGRSAPAVKLRLGSRWVYGSATQPRHRER